MFIPALAVTAGAAFALGWVARPDQSADAGASAADGPGSKRTSSSFRAGSRANTSATGKSARSPVDEFIGQYTSAGAVSPEDMTAAVQAVRKENDPILRRKLFSALLDNLTPENAEAAYQALQEGRRGGGPGRFGRGGDDELRLLANAWGRIDGRGAVEALTRMREEAMAEREDGERGEGRGRFGRGGDPRLGMDLAAVLSGWATADGSAAASYVNGIEDERERGMAGFGVVQGMMVNGVDTAMNYIASLPKTEDGDRTQSFYMSMVANEMLEDGVESAKAWVDSIGDPDLKGGALSRVAESAVRADLEGAVEWVTRYAADESASRAINRVANEWAEQDPAAVLSWADTLPDAAKAEAYGEAFEEWTRRDATAAGEYLTSMASSPARDAAVEEFASNLARQEPDTAIQWAETIDNQESRTETITRVARSWYRQDQEAASQWLSTSGLPEETVQSITEAPERGGFDFRRGGRGGRGR